MFRSLDSDQLARLQHVAYLASKPFCYSCYATAPTGTCKRCHSDDLMREVPGVGVEYGWEWVAKHLFESDGPSPIDLEARLVETVREVYGETTKVGWLTVDTVDVLREYATDWRCALSDEYSAAIDAGAVEIDGELYDADDVSDWLEDLEAHYGVKAMAAEVQS